MFTAPPFHPRCRTTTAPYFEDDFGEIGERAGYHIPENMSYEDWEKAFVDGDKSGLTSAKNGDIIKTTTNAAGKPVNIVSAVKTTGEPNTITQTVNKKGGISRNYYGSDGVQTKQISNNAHGHKAEKALGEHGEHAHDYYQDESGNIKHGKARELTDEERKENKDIL